MNMQNYKPQVLSLLKSIETGDSQAVSIINGKKYIQHNTAVADGLEGFGAVLQALPKGSAKVDTKRIFQDGNFVFTHTEYNFFGPKIGFDIFRLEDGKIVEHWDNLQTTPLTANPSGHSMVDGPTSAKDLEHTAENKVTANRFVDDILVHGRQEKFTSYFDGDNYIQHNPQIADNLSGLNSALQAMQKAGIALKYERIHKVLGEGDFVLVISEGFLGTSHSAFYDLFRLSGGKIAEHWDVIETITPASEHKNNNGKFGF